MADNRIDSVVGEQAFAQLEKLTDGVASAAESMEKAVIVANELRIATSNISNYAQLADAAQKTSISIDTLNASSEEYTTSAKEQATYIKNLQVIIQGHVKLNLSLIHI